MRFLKIAEQNMMARLFLVLLLLRLVHNGIEAFAHVLKNKNQLRPKTRRHLAEQQPTSATHANERVATTSPSSRPVSILVCPAQFCVPADYDPLLERLRDKIPDLQSAVTAPLPRTEWIKVARQLPTAAYIQGCLPVEKTLRWYFDAIEVALLDLMNNSSPADADIAIVGHSIGGWIARAYLGGMSCSSTAVYRQARSQVRSLVTLGTPHQPAPLDQTRGLIRSVAENPACHPRALQADGIRVTCVGSTAVKGGMKDGESLLALASYGSFVGDFFSAQQGDGIVPLESSLLDDPAQRVVLDSSRHIHVVPTPWNLWDGSSPSIALDERSSLPNYLSENVVKDWVGYI